MRSDPKFVLDIVDEGVKVVPRQGERTLKISSRYIRLCLSVMGRFFIKVISPRMKNGPRRLLRLVLPYAFPAGAEYAAGLNQW